MRMAEKEGDPATPKKEEKVGSDGDREDEDDDLNQVF